MRDARHSQPARPRPIHRGLAVGLLIGLAATLCGCPSSSSKGAKSGEAKACPLNRPAGSKGPPRTPSKNAGKSNTTVSHAR